VVSVGQSRLRENLSFRCHCEEPAGRRGNLYRTEERPARSFNCALCIVNCALSCHDLSAVEKSPTYSIKSCHIRLSPSFRMRFPVTLSVSEKSPAAIVHCALSFNCGLCTVDWKIAHCPVLPNAVKNPNRIAPKVFAHQKETYTNPKFRFA
jgi:hypothetical protein